MAKIRFLSLILVLTLLLAACGNTQSAETTFPTAQTEAVAAPAASESTAAPVIDPADLFTDRDLAGTYDAAESIPIELNGSGISCSSHNVEISGSTVTITKEGTYMLSGGLDDGMVIVNADKQDKVQLVLNDASIHSETCAPIYVLQADKVFLTLAEGTENSLSNGGTFTAIDENNIDAVVFSKEDLTMNGPGQLTITSPAGHGVVSKDELTVTGGVYDINSASHGLAGKDNVCITSAAFTIVSGKDGIHAENNDDAALGFAYIESGDFTITAAGDGISAAAQMEIAGGNFTITTGGGSANAQQQTSENWGGFMGQMPGGMGGGMGGPGGGMSGRQPGGNMGGMAEITTDTASEDSTSIKGIKAGGSLTIHAGTFTIDAADDAIHSNSSLTVGGGTYQIATGDDGFHADEALTILAGTICISESYEGLEGLSIQVSGGDISLTASDDGLNAAGGTDQSGFGGPRGSDMFGSSDSFINISGGSLDIRASGDGIDSNGTLTISGGSVTICGPTSGDTAVLDYEVSGVITGGTFIGTGAYQMAQTFSDSQQGVIALSVGNCTAGTQIQLHDADGTLVVSYAPELDFAIVIISTPDMVKGEAYTVTIGTTSESFEAS